MDGYKDGLLDEWIYQWTSRGCWLVTCQECSIDSSRFACGLCCYPERCMAVLPVQIIGTHMSHQAPRVTQKERAPLS